MNVRTRAGAAPLGSVLAAVLFSLGGARLAHGAGFYIGDVGTRAMGRGGAFVAAPDSPLALHYNPAGLSLTKGLVFEIDAAIVDLQGSFRRRCPCVDESFGTPEAVAAEEARLEGLFSSNRAETRTPLTIPFIGLSYGFDWMDAAVGLAVYGPTSGRFDYGLLGPASSPSFADRAARKVTRYNALEAPNLELNYAFGASLSPLDGLRVGFTIYLHQTGASQTLHLFADTAFAAGPEDTRWDIPLVLDFLSDPGFNWGLGVSWDIPWIPGLTLGGSFRADRSIRASGTIDVDLPVDLQGVATVEGDAVEVRLNIAPIVRAGLQYRRPGAFAAEAAVVWEGWSVNDRIVLEPEGIGFRIGTLDPVLLNQIVSERNWRDTASLRLGVEVETWQPWLTVQGGYFFEPSAIAPRWLDPSRIDLDKHGLSVGLGTEWSGISLNLSATYFAMVGAEVRDSFARNTAPLGFAPELRTVVGNGDYEAQYFIGGVGLGFSLEQFLLTRREEAAAADGR